VIVSFCQAYPEIELEIAASEEMVDVAAGGFDAGIRLGQFIAPDMVAVRLTPPFPLVVVGSPDYLRGQKLPERIDDLRGHACLRMRRSNGSIAPWPFVDGNKSVDAIVSGPLIARDYPTEDQRDDRTGSGETQEASRPLPEVARGFAGGDELLEGEFRARKESFASFGQTDAARCADEERCADSRLQCAYSLADRRDGVTASSAAALRKLRCWATLRNASTPSSAPCLTVKFCFIAHRYYRE
jgi:LysR substrate binding domain